MNEYITKEAAIEAIEDTNIELFLSEWKEIEEKINAIPIADVAPVVHGKWIEKQEEIYFPVQYGEDGELILHKHIRYFCNLCGRRSIVPEPYCHCGAKMEGVVDNETD